MMCRLLLSLSLIAAGVEALLPTSIQAALGEAAKRASQKYNCSVTIAFHSADGDAAAAEGVVDFTTHSQAQTSDKYAWGSCTKMFTAASIMKLVSKGAFGLDDRVAPLVDPLLARMASANPQQNFSSMHDLWGANVTNTTIRQLLAMQGGIPDFDTATPSRSGGPATDPLRAQLYDSPGHVYTPAELMSVPWVAGRWEQCKAHTPLIQPLCYSSTNFMILGLVLQAHSGTDSWQSFDQAQYLPPVLRSELQFAKLGAPKDFGAVHGYDRTSYNMHSGDHNDHDNWAVDGVFAGWTASNLVASTPAVARLAWEIYGPPSSVAPRKFMEEMVPKNMRSFYGLGTFNLGLMTGHKDTPFDRHHLGKGYGHLGATYGYQSISGYFPGLSFAMAVATNIETDMQSQPMDAFCDAYNTVAGILLNKNISCSFQSMGFFGGCKCSSIEEIIV